MLDTTRRALLVVHMAFTLTPCFAQEDTVRVQTLTFDSITTRRGCWVFPDASHTYRKVLMHHTLKCDPQTTQDQYACGEWDYLTHNLIHEHTGVLDSNALQHPWFKVGAAAPGSVDRAAMPSYDIRQIAVPRRTVIGTLSEALHPVGSGGAWDGGLLQAVQGTSRTQALYLASELSAAGLQPGSIAQLRFTTDGQGNGAFGRFTIRMKQTQATSAGPGFDDSALMTVHEVAPPTLGTVAGEQVFVLEPPFVWDGSSNLLVDLAAARSAGLSAPQVVGTAMPDLAVQAVGRDGHLLLKDDLIGVDPAPLANVGPAITLMFRAWGDSILPVNTTALEAVDAAGRRVLNVHLPWSNERVYWDAGQDGTGYDRIDKAATTADLEGRWNHWAFVKNAATGSMKIYLNGVLWHSGTGKTRPLAGITTFRLASGANGEFPYPGAMDEVNVFNTEVDAATIAAWADRAVDATHPNAADLLYSFHCDELPGEHILVNAADPAHNAWPLGTPRRSFREAIDLHHTAHPVTVRPDLVFVQGTYTSVTDTVLLERPEPRELLTQEHFQVNGNGVVPVDTVFSWLGGHTRTFAPDGAVLDSALVPSTLDLNDTLHYYGVPFEVVNNWEIGRYITPYGIGLSLGPQGFRWTFDVTDYQWLLHDSVELSAGNQQELIDLEFELIEGTPPRTVVAHQRPWGGLTSRSYADLSNDVALPPVTVQLSPAASQWSLRTRLTGHGHNSNDGQYPHCCEWKDNTHYLYLNGIEQDAWHIWQTNDCALNPVYPQGGTWLGSREGWCPGDLVKDHEVQLPGLSPGGTATLDYRITPVPANNQGMGGGNYVINMDLLEFGAAAHALDAEIVEVQRPSTTDMHRRNNPLCHDPLVVLRNAGAQDLTSVTFTYGVEGGTPMSWTWTGLLKHMERTEVVLPVDGAGFWVGTDPSVFTVSVSAPNGGADANPVNDSYRTAFALPAVYPETIVVNYKTNNFPGENSLSIRDVYGSTIFERTNHAANTTYSDTLTLFAGCYTVEFLDTGNDGLSYWADPGAGNGYFRLRRTTGSILKSFDPEFGRSIKWSFTSGALVGVEELVPAAALEAWPNPTNGLLTMGVEGILGDALVEVLDMRGAVVKRQQRALHGGDRLSLDLSGMADGLYEVRVTGPDRRAQARVVKQ
ncbi:MAG: T9SS type A sorting domain-containing protein [Flavobacteriales bacterium]|nr:T9SS type A sorting domain-containing protein [Flavobacteriales bacterium]